MTKTNNIILLTNVLSKDYYDVYRLQNKDGCAQKRRVPFEGDARVNMYYNNIVLKAWNVYLQFFFNLFLVWWNSLKYVWNQSGFIKI